MDEMKLTADQLIKYARSLAEWPEIKRLAGALIVHLTDALEAQIAENAMLKRQLLRKWQNGGTILPLNHEYDADLALAAQHGGFD